MLLTCLPALQRHWVRSSAGSGRWPSCRCASSPSWRGSRTRTLSQIERGLRAPSQHVVDGIARALHVSADALYEQAGMTPPGEEPEDNAVLDAIAADHRLTARQRKALAEIYESFVASSPTVKRSSS